MVRLIRLDTSARTVRADLPRDVQEREGVLFLVYFPDFLDFLRDGKVAGEDFLNDGLLPLVPILAQEESKRDVVIGFLFYFPSRGLLQGAFPLLP